MAPAAPGSLAGRVQPSGAVAGGAAGDLCPQGMNRPASAPAEGVAQASRAPGRRRRDPRRAPHRCRSRPLLALLAFATAAFLGAGHALTPGHGKTLMAAYLVGTRGTPRHALGLGAAVSVSHTIGILGLALVVVAAEAALPPDLVVRAAPIIAAVTILAIGGWMLLTEVRRWLATRRAAARDGAHATTTSTRTATTTRTRTTTTTTGTPTRIATPRPADDGLEHSHGGVTPPPRPGRRLDDHLALAVRPRPRRRPHPVDERAAHPADDDRRRPAGLGRRARRSPSGSAWPRSWPASASPSSTPAAPSSAGPPAPASVAPRGSCRSRASVLVLAVGVALTTQALGAARIV